MEYGRLACSRCLRHQRVKGLLYGTSKPETEPCLDGFPSLVSGPGTGYSGYPGLRAPRDEPISALSYSTGWSVVNHSCLVRCSVGRTCPFARPSLNILSRPLKKPCVPTVLLSIGCIGIRYRVSHRRCYQAKMRNSPRASQRGRRLKGSPYGRGCSRCGGALDVC